MIHLVFVKIARNIMLSITNNELWNTQLKFNPSFKVLEPGESEYCILYFLMVRHYSRYYFILMGWTSQVLLLR